MRNRHLLLALPLLLISCGPVVDIEPRDSGELDIPADALVVQTEGQHGGILHYALAGEPSHFNYTLAQDTRSKLPVYLTTGTLLEFDPLEQRVVEGVAKEWQVSADGRKVRVTLRRDLKFSDGVPVTSKDVLFTFEKIYEVNSRNVLRDALMIDGEPIAVQAAGDHTLDIHFPRPHAAAEFILTTVPVLPSHLLTEEGKKIEEYWTLDTDPNQMAGLGPFVVERHSPGVELVLRSNPRYWKVDGQGKRLPYLERIVLHYIEERNTQVLRFRAGELDLIDYLLRPEDALRLKEPEVQLFNAGASGTLTFFWFNLKNGPDWFQSRSFRQAVSSAVSRETIVRNVYLGHAEAAWTLIPSSFSKWHAPHARRYDHSPTKARDLLRQDGFSWRSASGGPQLVDPDGAPVTFEILTRSDDVHGKIAAILQNDLEAIGMQVAIRQDEFRTVISRVMSQNYDSALMQIDFPYDPADHMNVLPSGAPMHMWNPSQPEPATLWERRIDELMLAQLTETDAQERQGLYREVQKILAEEVPLVPLVHRDILVAARVRLHNVRPNSLFPYGLWNAWELWVEQ